MDLTVSDAVRLALVWVAADKALTCTIKAPNERTMSAMAESSDIIKIRRARFANVDTLLTDVEKASRD